MPKPKAKLARTAKSQKPSPSPRLKRKRAVKMESPNAGRGQKRAADQVGEKTPVGEPPVEDELPDPSSPDMEDNKQLLTMHRTCRVVRGFYQRSAPLSDKKKKQIIAALKGYCVQEDYDYLVERFMMVVDTNIPALFATMYIVKHMTEKLCTNPLWYLRPSGQEGTLQADLWNAGERFKGANYGLRNLWRMVTCRVANVYRLEGWGRLDLELSQSARDYRASLIRPMITEVLSSEIMQLFLREPEKINPGD
ncbi:uncharacterized protein BJX67DRAFT_382020 [Aspergillus lucknowensis]|uniref:Uncharacterized protein n=1 Tax=Aspergillus lucknowensis TaxID=176173 RepID=A0ABR4LNU6_9EURO